MHLDELAVASLNPAVPPDERWDINQHLFNEFKGAIENPAELAGDTFHDDLMQVVKDPLFTTGPIVPGDVGFGKAPLELQSWVHSWEGNVQGSKRRGRGHHAVLGVDEYGIVQSGQSRFIERPTAGGFEFLRSVVESVDIVRAILQTRKRQILAFCQPASDQNPLGFTFVRKDGERTTDKDKTEIQRLTSLLLNCGDEEDPRVAKWMWREDMTGFLSKFVWDSLSMDACPVETEMNRRGSSLSGIYSVPADTIRLCTEQGYEGRDEYYAVQLVDSVPYLAFGYDDLVYEVRNPRSNIYVNRYGYSETEMCMRVLTSYLHTFDFNSAGLSRNSIPRGVMVLFGEYDKRELNAFKVNLRSMLHGASNRWTMPVLASKTKEGGAAWVPMDQYNEMFFAKWFTLLVSIACALWSIDPREVHFDSFSSQNSSPLGKSDTEEKIKHSRDKGLIPLVSFIQSFYNRYIIPLWSKQYELRFTGLHEEDPDKKQERIKLYSTIDELRLADGKNPHPDPVVGASPASQTHMQLYLMQLQQKMAAEQQEQQGMGGGEDDEGAGGDGEDYRRDQFGQHSPYGKDGDSPYEGDHLHTLALGARDADEAPERKFAKAALPHRRATATPAPKRGARFSVRVDGAPV